MKKKRQKRKKRKPEASVLCLEKRTCAAGCCFFRRKVLRVLRAIMCVCGSSVRPVSSVVAVVVSRVCCSHTREDGSILAGGNICSDYWWDLLQCVYLCREGAQQYQR